MKRTLKNPKQSLQSSGVGCFLVVPQIQSSLLSFHILSCVNRAIVMIMMMVIVDYRWILSCKWNSKINCHWCRSKNSWSSSNDCWGLEFNLVTLIQESEPRNGGLKMIWRVNHIFFYAENRLFLFFFLVMIEVWGWRGLERGKVSFLRLVSRSFFLRIFSNFFYLLPSYFFWGFLYEF